MYIQVRLNKNTFMQKLPYRLESKVNAEVERFEAYKRVAAQWESLVDGAEFKNKAGSYAEAFAYPSQRDVEDGYTYEDDGSVHSHLKGVHVGVWFGQDTKHYVSDEKVVKGLVLQLAEVCAEDLKAVNAYYAERVAAVAPLVEKVEMAEVELERAQQHVRDVEDEIDALMR